MKKTPLNTIQALQAPARENVFEHLMVTPLTVQTNRFLIKLLHSCASLTSLFYTPEWKQLSERKHN